MIYILTHDSIGVGEDGPTHQPVEHLASLRAIPGLVTLRPGDANEVVEAYRYIMQLTHEPAVLARVTGAGIDIYALAAQLQHDGAQSFVKSWNELMTVIASKSAALARG